MATDDAHVTVHVSAAQRDRTNENRRIARVSVSKVRGGAVSLGEIRKNMTLDSGMTFTGKDGLMFISGDNAQIDRFLPLVIAAVKAAGYEVTNE